MPVARTTLVEPGPVVTEFEKKVYEDAEKMDLSEADEETARIFWEIYLPYSKKVFLSLGQTPEEVAEVSGSWILSYTTTHFVRQYTESQCVSW